MGMRPKQIVCDEEARAKLLEMAIEGGKQASLRARIVLLCINGRTIKKIAEDCGTSVAIVNRWKSRFMQDGLDGLCDRKHTGRPTAYGQEFEQSVWEKLSQEPFREWNCVLLAKELGYSKNIHAVQMAIWRFLKKCKIKL